LLGREITTFVGNPYGTELDIHVLGQRAPKETRMSSGTIKRLVRDRGFGFIRDDGGQEWFFIAARCKAASTS
jgi:hypothetical protein